MRHALGRTGVLFCLALPALIAGLNAPASAQPAGLSNGEKQAWSIVDDVVRITTTQANGDTGESGFGFVFGERDGNLFVATADHVVRKGASGTGAPGDVIPAAHIFVTFHGDQGHHYSAELLEVQLTGKEGDLAVLELPRPRTINLTWPTATGDEALVDGTKAWRVGKRDRWVPAATPGTYVGRSAIWFNFDGLDTPPGSSGGPVVTENGIIGMIVQDGGLSGFPTNVLPINTISAVLRGWQLPWNIRGSSPRPPPASAPDNPAPPPSDPAAAELAMNMSDDQRRAIQHALNQLGFSAGDEDGEFGAQTRQAIRGYQARTGAPATGFIDAALAQRLAAEAQKSPADSGPSANAPAPRDLVYRYYANEAGMAHLDALRTILADTIAFYGQTLTRDQVLQQHVATYQRWPVRSFAVRPNSLIVSCSPTGASCHADGVVDYDFRSPERNALSNGSERFVLQLGRDTDGTLKIEGINSVGIERSTGPIAPITPPAQPGGGPPAVDTTRWTTHSPRECSRFYYTWREFGDTYQFVDQSKQTDIEHVIERSPTRVLTQTTSSAHQGDDAPTPIGTRWSYSFQPDGTVRVQNLQTGRSFTLTRCSS